MRTRGATVQDAIWRGLLLRLLRLPGTDGRDAKNQAPATTRGMEFVSVNAPMPTEGDTEVEPVPITEEDELVVPNSPIDDEGYMNDLIKKEPYRISCQARIRERGPA